MSVFVRSRSVAATHHYVRVLAFVLPLTMPLTAAVAQRASENAVAAADDAFGTQVGNESIGLYTPTDARGFNPTNANNIRIEGMYFDQQSPLNNNIAAGSTIHVGISAQSYPFPAPTGVADFHLRLPGDTYVTSVQTTLGTYNTYGTEIDSQIPLVPGKLSLGVGGGANRSQVGWSATYDNWSTGLILRWRPTDTTEIVPFYSRADTYDYEVEPYIFLPANATTVPPEYKRGTFYSQPWTDWDYHQTNYGVLGHTELADNWALRAGIFRSLQDRPHSYSDLFLNTQPSGLSTDHVIFELPDQYFASTSGEVRLSHAIAEGDRLHVIQATLRGRDVVRDVGGPSTVDFGPTYIGVTNYLQKPNYNPGPTTDDHAKQGTVGVAYDLTWKGLGSASFGLQKTMYRRVVTTPGIALADRTGASPLLYNGTLAIDIFKGLTAYGSYTRGLEESGIAPESAINNGEALPVSLTQQIDGGIAYAITPTLKLVAGVFDVKKPYFGLAPNQFYEGLGEERHRGVEFSMAGQVADGLTVVAGVVLIQARVEGDAVAKGITGKVPVGPIPRVTRLNFLYGPESWNGFSVDALLENLSSHTGSINNLVKIPAVTTVNLGARYRFTLYDVPSTVRFQVQNIADAYGWTITTGDIYQPNERRRFLLTLTSDF